MRIVKPILAAAMKCAARVSDHTGWEKYQFRLESQWWSGERLEAYQWEKLKKTLHHAYAEVPLYRKLWKEHGVHPDDIKDRRDMAKLPIVQRTDINATNCTAQSDRFKKKLQSIYTSGSTGTPFSVLIDVRSYQHKFALWLREMTFTGWDVGTRMISYWHRGSKSYSREEPYMLVRDVLWGVMGKRIFPPFPTERSTEPRYHDALAWYNELKRYSPYLMDSIHCFVQILTNFIVDNNLDPVPVKAVFCLGTPSSHERERWS